MASLHAGALLARRYRLIDQIGAGGMSVIWRARDEVLDRVVAVKVLAPALASNNKFRELVREEARAAAQLVHPHVTAVHDYGETVAPDGRVTSFVVMELLTGEELEAILTAGPLPWPAAVEICAQVAEALAAAHRLGIVHRDITPANVMMTPMGAKVLDFGIATHVGAPDEDEDGETFGTPAYVAPERLDGTPAQPATDTYSLGVLLYQTLTGRVPFPAETWDDLTRARDDDAVVPPLTGVPGLPEGVADICHRCLTRDPAGRPTAHQVGETLRRQLRISEMSVTEQISTRAGDPVPTQAPVPATVLPAATVPAAVVPPVAAPGTAAATLAAPTAPTPLAAPTAPTASAALPAPTASATLPAGPARAHVVGYGAVSGAGGAAVSGAGGAGVAVADRGGGAWSPLRALLLATATVVTLAAAVLAFSSLGNPRTDPRVLPTAAGPDEATPTTPADETAPPAEPPPSTAATTPTRSAQSLRQPGAATPTLGEAVAQVDRLINEGIASGAIVDHAGVDLRNYLRNLRNALHDGSSDVSGQVDEIRDKVAVRTNEGSINPGYAGQLDAALVRLAAAA